MSFPGRRSLVTQENGNLHGAEDVNCRPAKEDFQKTGVTEGAHDQQRSVDIRDMRQESARDGSAVPYGSGGRPDAMPAEMPLDAGLIDLLALCVASGDGHDLHTLASSQ